MLGTASYISPEQAVGDAATAASDRYALAVVAFELLTGERPFQAENFAAQARAHVEDPPPHASEINPDLPPEVDDVLDRGMDKDPEARWNTAGELVDRLEQALEAPPPPPPTRRVSAPPVRQRPEAPHARGAPIAAALIGVIVLGARWPSCCSPGGDGARRQRRRQSAKSTPTREATKEPTKTATPRRPRRRPRSRPTRRRPRPRPRRPRRPRTRPSRPPAARQADLDKARQLQLAGFNARNRRLREGPPALPAGDRLLRQLQRDRPCGYALFEKGLALNRLGRPDEAIPVLQDRLQRFGDNPDGEVSKELKAAKKAAKG